MAFITLVPCPLSSAVLSPIRDTASIVLSFDPVSITAIVPFGTVPVVSISTRLDMASSPVLISERSAVSFEDPSDSLISSSSDTVNVILASTKSALP